MSSILLSKGEQGIVIFHIWKSLPYKTRLLISGLLILTGFVIQYSQFNFFPGILFVFAGNLLLLVKGYDNRVKLKSLVHNAEWVATSEEQLLNTLQLLKRMKKWDISPLDITSGLGFLFFILTQSAILLILVINPFSSTTGALILIVNFVLLLIPHWFTGTKRIMTNPVLENKVKIYLELMKSTKEDLKDDSIKYNMLVNSGDQKIPMDVKMQIKFKNQPDDFLGLYTQIAMNNVQGADYPYFYVVLVAKKEFGLHSNYFDSVELPKGVTKEMNVDNDIEIIVIRQTTSKSSGYHTNAKAIARIFKIGVDSARKILEGNR